MSQQLGIGVSHTIDIGKTFQFVANNTQSLDQMPTTTIRKVSSEEVYTKINSIRSRIAHLAKDADVRLGRSVTRIREAKNGRDFEAEKLRTLGKSRGPRLSFMID